MLSPSVLSDNLYLHAKSYLYLFNVYLFCIFSCLMGIGLKLTNLHLFWPLLYPFLGKNSEYYVIHIKNISVFLVCILSYYTYSGTKYLERQFDHIS